MLILVTIKYKILFDIFSKAYLSFISVHVKKIYAYTEFTQIIK